MYRQLLYNVILSFDKVYWETHNFVNTTDITNITTFSTDQFMQMCWIEHTFSEKNFTCCKQSLSHVSASSYQPQYLTIILMHRFCKVEFGFYEKSCIGVLKFKGNCYKRAEYNRTLFSTRNYPRCRSYCTVRRQSEKQLYYWA